MNDVSTFHLLYLSFFSVSLETALSSAPSAPQPAVERPET